MPPKKQQQQPTTPIVTWNILPIIHDAPKALQFLKKPVNLKKTIDLTKSIELLKQKGIDKYLVDGKLSQQGYLFIGQNLNQISQDYLTSLRKPADPKKQVKKDSKKDNKKEQVIEQAQKTIQFTFEKSVTDFLFICQLINSERSLESLIKNGWRPDIVVLIEQKIDPLSELPNYKLLNNQRTIDDFMKEINSTPAKPNQHFYKDGNSPNNDLTLNLIQTIKRLRMQQKSDLQNTIIIEVPFLQNLQHPENDGLNFLKQLFSTLCSLTIKRTQYQAWYKNKQVINMVPTIKQKIKRQVVIEEKKEDKKGGKKEPNQPQTQIIQEIIQKKYEDIPENIKSNLSVYLKIANKRTNQSNIYKQTFQNLALTISSLTQRPNEIQSIDYNSLGNLLKKKNAQRPLNKITIDSILQKLPNISIKVNSNELNHINKFITQPITTKISLYSLLKNKPNDVSLQFQYKLRQFTDLIKNSEPNIHYNFETRKYRQTLSAQQLNSFINHQLQLGPKIYCAQSRQDNYNLLILARVNPPGRVMYDNSIFEWKVLPNFENWTKYFQNNNDENNEFYNYNWRSNGNLKILNKKMMPSDNMIINQSLYYIGDQQHKIISLDKEDITYTFQKIQKKYIFTKIYQHLKTSIYSEDNSQQISISLQAKLFTVVFNQFPTIFWSNSQLQSKRKIGNHGQIIRYLNNGHIQIYYPNGNRSTFSYSKWIHIKDHIQKTQNGEQLEMKRINKVDGDKKIIVREDDTIFIDFINGDKIVMFHDGTIYRHIGHNKLQILNKEGIIIRIIKERTKNFNIIGSGSAFAYLGEKDIIQRSYAGGLFQLHHPQFTWHNYTQCNDNDGNIIQKSQIFLLHYKDGSVIKGKMSGVLTFLHKNNSTQQSILHQRWLQLFTNSQYHSQGVYDVNVFQGTIITKDNQSNQFKVSLNQQSNVKIAVSFNINNDKAQPNRYGNGYHVPSQNYFLPQPSNCVTPRLFIINHDGSGQEILSQQQLSPLRQYKMVKINSQNRNFIQFNKLNRAQEAYIQHKFTAKIQKNMFKLPNLLVQAQKRINLVPSTFPDLLFRNIQEISWDPTFKNVIQVSSAIEQTRNRFKNQLQMLKQK